MCFSNAGYFTDKKITAYWYTSRLFDVKKCEKFLKKYYHIVYNYGIIKKKWNTAHE